MAGDWMKVGLTTPDKPEIYQIADYLGIDPDAAFGKCFRVWAWFDQHTTSGHAPSVTNVTLKRVTGHDEFVTAMINVGWLREEGDELIMVGFDRHNGESSKNRALASERQRKSREKVTEMSRNNRDKSVTREEKRREENIKSKANNLSDESDEIPPKPPEPDYEKEFEEVWAARPPRRHESKRAALKAYKARRRAGATFADILAGVDRYRAYIDSEIRQGNSDRFTKHLSTFLGPDGWFELPWEPNEPIGPITGTQSSDDFWRSANDA